MRAPYLFSRLALPETVQRVAARTVARDCLRESPFLCEDVWLDLLSDHRSSRTTKYLRVNLTQWRVTRVLEAMPSLDLEERQRSDVDLELASWMLRHPPSEPVARKVLASGLPNSANVALLSGRVSLRTKQRLAALAYRSDRIFWLALPEALAVGDDEAWGLATLPDTLEQCCSGTMLDTRLRSWEVMNLAQLLHVRPSLRDRAVASKEPWILMAASSVRLDEEQQRLLVASSEEHFTGPDAGVVLDALSSYYSKEVDPIGNLASTPWCSKEVWAHLESRQGITWVKDGRLLRRDDLGYRRHREVRNLERLPAADLRSADAGTVKAWLEHSSYSSQPSAPFVVLETLANRGLPSHVSRLRRGDVLWSSDRLGAVLQHLGNRFTVNLKEPLLTRYSPPETEVAREDVGVAYGHCEMGEALLFGDGGISVMLAAGLTTDEWEVALTLLVEGFQGTVDELVDVSRSI